MGSTRPQTTDKKIIVILPNKKKTTRNITVQEVLAVKNDVTSNVALYTEDR